MIVFSKLQIFIRNFFFKEKKTLTIYNDDQYIFISLNLVLQYFMQRYPTHNLNSFYPFMRTLGSNISNSYFLFLYSIHD